MKNVKNLPFPMIHFILKIQLGKKLLRSVLALAQIAMAVGGAGVATLQPTLPSTLSAFQPLIGEAQSANAVVIEPFTQKYEATVKGGNITYLGNNNMMCEPGSIAYQTFITCEDTQSGAQGNTNDNFPIWNADADSDGVTFNSSASTLTLPSNAEILYARLYWSGAYPGGTTYNPMGDPNAQTLDDIGAFSDTIKFKIPGSSNYVDLTADEIFSYLNGSGNFNESIAYGAVKDVPTLVTQGGAGQYWAADIYAGSGRTVVSNANDPGGGGNWGGWTLVVAYKDPAITKPRYLAINDGFVAVATSETLTWDMDGFRIPSGSITKNVGCLAWDGDAGIQNDKFYFNSSQHSDALHLSNDFFRAIMSTDGVSFDDRSPYHYYTLAQDVFDNSTISLSPGDTSASLTIETTGDRIIPQACWFVTETDPAIIGDHIWIDNGTPNGIYEVSDSPASGIVVTATATGGAVYTGTTDATGAYSISVPLNDTYVVTYGVPPTLSISANPISNTDSSTNNKNHTNGVSVVITTSNNLNIDFALKQEVLLGNHIWLDKGTSDGIYNGSDQPVSGVVVTATSSGGQTYVATTDASGLYTITVPANDTYTVTYRLPITYQASVSPTLVTNDSTNDKNHTNGLSVVITTSNNLNIDFALKQEVLLGNHIWVDAGTPDGIYNGSDQPVSGVVVTATSSGGQTYVATTNASGLYTITVPANDTYSVSYGLPVGYSAGVNPTSNTDSSTNDENHTNGVSVVITTSNNLNIDFALKQEVLLGNHIWVDAGTPDGIYNGGDQPVSGVVVTATSSGGQTYVATTDASGL